MYKIDETFFKELLLKKTPLIDVRSEGEFEKGAVPGSVNIPILNNYERDLVGKCYRFEGQEKAIELGHELVHSEIKNKRVQSWLEVRKENPEAVVYCARGGLRSHITCEWLEEKGDSPKLVKGGFKALRNFLLNSLSENVEKSDFLVLAGKTGSGKTVLLNEYKDILDLEKRANHRGSSFGKHLTTQPSQIDFENNLSIDLINIMERERNRILVEDESRLIGIIHLPDFLSKKMAKSGIVVLETPMEERVDSILKEYVTETVKEYEEESVDGYDRFSEKLLFNLKRISKKLGGLKYEEIRKDMNEAFNAHRKDGDIELHRVWIEKLLTLYYDPMYTYGLKKRSEQVLFTGNYQEIMEWNRENKLILG